MACSLGECEDAKTHLHEIVASESLTVESQLRFSVRHEVDLLDSVCLVGVKSLQTDVAERLLIAWVKVVGEDDCLLLVLRYIIDSGVVALVRRDKAILLTIKDYALEAAQLATAPWVYL